MKILINEQQYRILVESLLELSGNIDYSMINIITKNFSKGSEILEISSGNSADALELKNLGYNIVCTELNDSYVQNALDLGLECIKHDTTKKFPFKNKSFDLIYS